MPIYHKMKNDLNMTPSTESMIIHNQTFFDLLTSKQMDLFKLKFFNDQIEFKF